MEIQRESSLQRETRVLVGLAEIGYATRMVWHNQIAGFLTVDVRQKDQEIALVYDVTGMISMQDYLSEHELTYSLVKHIVEQVLTCVEQGYSYLLRDQDYLLCPEMVFGDENFEHIKVAYFEGYSKPVTDQMLVWAEAWMGRINHRDRELVELVYGIYHICKEQGTLAQLRHLCTKEETVMIEEEPTSKVDDSYIDRESSKTEWNEESPELDVKEITRFRVPSTNRVICIGVLVFAISINVFLLIATKVYRYSLSGRIDTTKLIAGLLLSTGIAGYLIYRMRDVRCQEPMHETAVEECEEVTVLLGSKETLKEQYILVPEEKNQYQSIELIEFPFFIGKLKTKSNGIIPSKEVSRYHAKIERDGEQFLLTDLGSTNGTYVNNTKLAGQEAVVIHEEDCISFANVSYRFIGKAHLV